MYPHPPQPQPQKKSRGCLYTTLGCAAAVAVLLLIVVVASVAFSGGSEPAPPTAAEPGASEAAGDSGDQTEAKMGEPVTSGAFTFTVTDVETGVTELSDESGFMTETPDGQYVIVHLTVENTGDEAGTFDATAQTLTDAQGKSYSADGEAAAMTGNTDAFLNEINPGNSVKAQLPFDVPEGVEPATIELSDFLSLDSSAVVTLS